MARAVGAIARGLGKVFDGLGSSLGFGYRETRECQLHAARAPMAAPARLQPCWPGRRHRHPRAKCCRRRLPPLPRPAVNKAQCVQAFGGKRPVLGTDVFVAPNASVIGDVKLGSGASVWYGTVIRGELPNLLRCVSLPGQCPCDQRDRGLLWWHCHSVARVSRRAAGMGCLGTCT